MWSSRKRPRRSPAREPGGEAPQGRSTVRDPVGLRDAEKKEDDGAAEDAVANRRARLTTKTPMAAEPDHGAVRDAKRRPPATSARATARMLSRLGEICEAFGGTYYSSRWRVFSRRSASSRSGLKWKNRARRWFARRPAGKSPDDWNEPAQAARIAGAGHGAARSRRTIEAKRFFLSA